MLINRKNNVQSDESVLDFTKNDYIIVFFVFLVALILNFISNALLKPKAIIVLLFIYLVVSSFIFYMINLHRETEIKNKKNEVQKIFRALSVIYGEVDMEEIDMANLPFEFSYDDKTKIVNKIIVDTSVKGIKINENVITEAQYSINKFIPEFMWKNTWDEPNLTLTFEGQPKPPKIAFWPGSDYIDPAWIPLGVSGDGVVGWNMGDIKESNIGIQSFIYEDTGETPKTVITPSAPQGMVIGGTGSGKSVSCESVVEVKSE